MYAKQDSTHSQSFTSVQVNIGYELRPQRVEHYIIILSNTSNQMII